MPAKNGAIARDRHAVAASDEKVERTFSTGARFKLAEDASSPAPGGIATFARAHSRGLSNRALNVLKMLAAEITGECATGEQWIPSTALLREMTFKHLLTARNCGPRTTAEIVQWAQSQGVTIQPLLYAGKSLSETWRDLSAKFTAGELTHAEIAAALEKSVRRKSTTIPIAVQKILMHLLNTANGKS